MSAASVSHAAAAEAAAQTAAQAAAQPAQQPTAISAQFSAPQATNLAGFANPVHDAQRTFRAILDAMARPTLPQTITAVRGENTLATPAPLGRTVGAILLTLCDEQTPIWVDAALRASTDVCGWITFHTGAKIVDDVQDALFVAASSPSAMPSLESLAQGNDEEPHLSATLIIDASGTRGTSQLTATGPGINGQVEWDGAGLPYGFLAQWQANTQRFPRGVDVLLAGEGRVRALPRTTQLTSGPVSEPTSEGMVS